MSVARIAFGTVLTAILFSAAGCRVSVTTKERYKEDDVKRQDPQDWAGQKITIDVQGVGLSVNGGVEVTARADVTKVAASARMLAMAFVDDKPMADLSISEAKETYKITNTPTDITVSCGHGGSHASSNGGESGCELIKVFVPLGSADKPLEIEVKGGNGPMTVILNDAFIKNVGISNQDDIRADLPATRGANIQVTSHKSGDIVATVPSNWAADKVTIEADPDKITNSTDAKTDGSGGRGTPGEGLTGLKLTSISFAGSTGKVTLQSR